MKEPKLKKKSVINKIIKKQSFVAITTIFLLIFILVGSSYALLNANTETGLTDVVVQSGNLIATISSTNEMIEMNYTTLGVSDEVGLSYEPYTFTVKNDGENTISYYEIRIVDKEYEISTLPHKSLNYALSINDGDYTEPQNLGDNRSYIYVGGSLESGESDTFNLKLWVNEEFGKYANNKILKASIELTLYSDIPTRNYIIYDTQGGNYIPKTSVSSKRVTNQVPTKEGYSFAGWSSTPDGEVEYESNAIYNSSMGTTLYAVWGKLSSAAEKIIEKVVAYNVSSPTTFTGGLVAVNTDGELYNENDTNQQIREYRYSGQEVNNYVYFNCKDNDGTYDYGDENYNYNEANCELWRIIGVFKNSADEWNLKLMRNYKMNFDEVNSITDGNEYFYVNKINYRTQTFDYGGIPWSYPDVVGTGEFGWHNAGLQYFLNMDEDNVGTKGYFSTITSSSRASIDIDYEYKLGNVMSESDTALTAYNNERDENNIFDYNEPSWNGAVALLYPSDYGYASHNSKWKEETINYYAESNWMAEIIANEWFLSLDGTDVGSGMVLLLSDYAELYHDAPEMGHFARPVLNLKSSVIMLNGIEQDGSIDKPYIVAGM